jgi:hypothetical protein
MDELKRGSEVLMKIRSEKLTICNVAMDGRDVGLEFIDSSGATVTLELPFEQAEAIAMTLPNLLARALKQQTGDDDARYVFGLGEWSVESARDQACLIATLKTIGGFEISFGIPLEACHSLGWILQQRAEQVGEDSGVSGNGGTVALSHRKFN